MIQEEKTTAHSQGLATLGITSGREDNDYAYTEISSPREFKYLLIFIKTICTNPLAWNILSRLINIISEQPEHRTGYAHLSRVPAN